MNELIQKFSETAPEVWEQLVARTIFFGWFGVVFGVVLLGLGTFAGFKGRKLVDSFDEDMAVLLHVAAGFLLLLGVIIFAGGIIDLLYPLAGAAKSLVHN